MRAPSPRAPRAVSAFSLSLALAGALAFSGCNSSDDKSDKAPSAQATTKGLTVQGAWPLTGEPARGATPKHPIMVVKIDNTSSSAPQIGLGKADLVTEELVEGGLTRLAVFFYQRIPQRVGPVRSMRATDIGIVKPAKADLVASGGAPPTVARLRGAGITTFTEGATGYQRDGARRAPYNLFMNLRQLTKKVKARSSVPSYLPFGKASNLPRGTRARGLSAVFSTGHTTRWTYDGRRYVNQNSYAAQGDRFRPDNVLVLRVTVGDAGYRDPAGNPVPETKFTGTGKALLFHGGKVVRGSWKKSLTSTITLRDAKGRRLAVPVGHTWIELVPKRTGNVIVSR